MKKLLVRRLLAAIVVLLLASILVFALSRMSGDPRHLFLSEYTTNEQWEQWGRDFGLDKPYYEQYFRWLAGAVLLDFDISVKEQIPATTVVLRKIPNTLQLAAGAYVFALAVGIPLGIFSSIFRGTILDLFARGFALLGQAMPGILAWHNAHSHFCRVAWMGTRWRKRRPAKPDPPIGNAWMVRCRCVIEADPFCDARDT